MITSNHNIAIVVSLFNAHITEKLLQGTVDHLQQAGLNGDQLKIVKVPGAVEIPLTAKLLAQSKKYEAIICLGAVIRGETDHYDYVCQQVSQGCQQVMLQFDLPVIFGILTTHNDQQALARVTTPEQHKGIEAAEAALTMLKIINQLMV